MKSTLQVYRLALGFLFGFLSLAMSIGASENPSSPASEDLLSAQGKSSRTESYVDRVRDEGNFLELGLKDVLKLALIHNLDITIESYNEELTHERVIGNKGFYDPILNFNVGWSSRKTPATTILDAGAGLLTSESDSFLFNSSLDQNVFGGGSLRLRFDNNRFFTNNSFSFINPRFGSDFEIRFQQPLGRGFLKTQTERQLKILNLDSQIDDSRFEQRVSEIVQEVQNQYWELAYSIANHEVRRTAVDLAFIQRQNNERRVEIGVLAPIEVTSSRAEVASREQIMIQSEVAIISAQNALKQLLAADPKADIWGLSLLPTERPQARDVSMSLDDAIETALSRRPEMRQARLELEKNEIDREFYRKEKTPQFDFTALFGSQGRTGRVLQDIREDLNDDGFPETVVDTILFKDSPSFGNLTNAWGQVFDFDFTNWEVSLNVQIPLGNRAAKAQLAEVAVRDRILTSQLKKEQQAIIVDVRNAFESLSVQKKRLDAARSAKELSKERMDGEHKRFEAGLSTNFEVLILQRDFAETSIDELRAMVDYQLAVVALQKAIYTIIDSNDILIARGNSK